jgi:4,5-DOPA dioxygenase extradiol
MRMPALFIGHGNPMNAIERNEFHRGWAEVAARLPRPKAILCVSAHWETRGAWVTAAARPATIHDFYGFPKALFDVRYPAPGDPALAARVAGLVTSERVGLDPERGLDHGAWSVLIAMYPAADVPVVQLGMDTSLPGAHHVALARQLAALRDEGVLVLGSGNIVHNLRLFDFRDPAPLDWALAADATIRRMIADRRLAELAAYPDRPESRLAVPTPEHYLPLLYVVALQQPDEEAGFFNVAVPGSISMTSVLIGARAEA